MGITPTTATINVLKYGAERKRARRLSRRRPRATWRGTTCRSSCKGLDAAEARAHPRRRGALSAGDAAAGQRRRHAGAQLDPSRARGDGAQVHRRGGRGLVAVHRRPGGQGDRGRGARQDQGGGQEDPRRGQQDRSLLARGAAAHHRARAAKRSASTWRRSCRSPRARRCARASRATKPSCRRRTIAALAAALEERFFSRARAIKREAATHAAAQLLDAGAHDRAGAARSARARADRQPPRSACAPSGSLFERDFMVAERPPPQRGRRRASTPPARARCSTSCARVAGRSAATRRRRPIATFSSTCSTSGSARSSRTRRARARAEAETRDRVVRAVDDAGDARASTPSCRCSTSRSSAASAPSRAAICAAAASTTSSRASCPSSSSPRRRSQRALERDAPWSDDVAEAELRAPLRAGPSASTTACWRGCARLRTAVELDRLEIEERLIAPVEQLAIALDSLVVMPAPFIHDELDPRHRRGRARPDARPDGDGVRRRCARARRRRSPAPGVTDSKRSPAPTRTRSARALIPRSSSAPTTSRSR